MELVVDHMHVNNRPVYGNAMHTRCIPVMYNLSCTTCHVQPVMYNLSCTTCS